MQRTTKKTVLTKMLKTHSFHSNSIDWSILRLAFEPSALIQSLPKIFFMYIICNLSKAVFCYQYKSHFKYFNVIHEKLDTN